MLMELNKILIWEGNIVRETKIRYTFKHVGTGNIEKKVYTLSQLEARNVSQLSPCFNVGFGYELIGRDEYTGLKDKNGNEIYEGDILDDPEEKPLYVEFSTKFAAFCFVDKFDPCGPTFYTTKDLHYEDLKVIGNIYFCRKEE